MASKRVVLLLLAATRGSGSPTEADDVPPPPPEDDDASTFPGTELTALAAADALKRGVLVLTAGLAPATSCFRDRHYMF